MNSRRLTTLASMILAACPVAALAEHHDQGEEVATKVTQGAILNQRAEEIGKVFLGEIAYEAVFTDAFIDAVPKAQFDAITAQLTSQMGAYAGVHAVTPTGDSTADVRFLFGEMLANTILQLASDGTWKVAGFRITGTSPILAEGETISDKIAQLPGTTNLLFAKLDGSEPIEAHNAEMSLAIGSAFKLWVLSALVRDIEAGKRAWDDVMVMEKYSVPTGGMQNWPYRSPVTLHTLATMMIATSDNTATDELIALLGRDKVEAELALTGHSDPARNIPFLSTREFMLLKWCENQGRFDYEALSEAEKRATLEQISWEGVGDAMVNELFGADRPQHIDIEWFATPGDLARVMQRLERNIEARKILTENKGFPPGSAGIWSYIGYKGGSEPGVINFTWILVNDLKEPHILTMSWNNPEAGVDLAQFMGLAQEIMATNKQQRYMQVPATR